MMLRFIGSIKTWNGNSCTTEPDAGKQVVRQLEAAMNAWILVAALCLAPAIVWGQPVPDNLPHKFGTNTEKSQTATCTSESKTCTDWCDTNNKTSNTCKQECPWHIDYCKRRGL